MDLFLRQWLRQDGVSKVVDKLPTGVIPGRAAVWGPISERRFMSVMLRDVPAVTFRDGRPDGLRPSGVTRVGATHDCCEATHGYAMTMHD
jgi:hypothetical protein